MATQAGAIGLDFGSSRTSIAVAKKGGVEVILNESSARETQNIVGYGDNERFIGEQGFIKMKSNLKNTVQFFNRFLGMHSDSAFLPQESKWLTCPLGVVNNNKIGFDISYQGERKVFLPEQVTATMLQKLKKIIQKADLQANDMVISVPSFFTEQERKALLDAAKIAEINVVRLFNEESASKYNFYLLNLCYFF